MHEALTCHERPSMAHAHGRLLLQLQILWCSATELRAGAKKKGRNVVQRMGNRSRRTAIRCTVSASHIHAHTYAHPSTLHRQTHSCAVDGLHLLLREWLLCPHDTRVCLALALLALVHNRHIPTRHCAQPPYANMPASIHPLLQPHASHTQGVRRWQGVSMRAG